MDCQFWNKKRVFITGHTGFKGSWLSLWLQKLGAELTGFALDPPTNPNLFTSARIDKGMNSIIGDIRDFPKLQSAIKNFNPEILIHMAAQPLVRQSYISPVETYETNIMGTVHVLEAIRGLQGISSTLIVTSDKCYANSHLDRPYRESDTLGGHDPYSSSKSCAELVTTSYRSSFFGDNEGNETAIASARAGNVIGGGDWAKDRLVPDIIDAFMNNHPAIIRNPNAVRPWQHVLEPISGYLNLLERLHKNKKQYASAWNFGPPQDQHMSVEWVVCKMAELWGKEAMWQKDSSCLLHETKLLRLDSAKAINQLEWAPHWSIEQALNATIAWHKAFLTDADMHSFSTKQIESFTSSKYISSGK